MSEIRVVVIGSANTDMIVTAPRIPAPGETILGGAFSVAQGGKGANQAVAAARLGAKTTFIARLGQDVFGETSLACYEKEGIDTRYIARDAQTPSGVALIMVDAHGENAIAVASGANMKLTPEDVDGASDAISTARVVLLQLEIPYETAQRAVALASRAGAPIILNPAPARPLDDALLARVDFITPNESEVEALTGIRAQDEKTAHQAARRLLDRGVGAAIITLGARGAWWARGNESGLIPAPRVQAVDTTAAGDAFNGALAVGLAEGKALTDAICFASQVAALSVTRVGAQPSLPFRQDILET